MQFGKKEDSMLKKYIGDKKFYRLVLTVAIPIMIQNGITNFVSLLDNIMVGRLGTEAMSGVSIVNQYVFIFNLLVFGAVSAAGIFTAQYFGNEDNDGIRYTFRFKFLISLAVGAISILVFALFDDALINLFLHTSEGEGDLTATLAFGKRYLRIMLVGLLPYSLSQHYASTMRETGETVLPMLASLAAVATNFALNVVLIFGYLVAPALGVAGAAIATVTSRFLELVILIIYAHTHTEKFPYLVGAYRSMYIPRGLALQICAKGVPLMANEFLWSLSVTLRNQCYSLRGLDVVAALNITTTLQNVLSVAYIALGNALAIIVGRQLGAGELDEAQVSARHMRAFIVFAAAVFGVLFAGGAFLFPLIYNTTAAVRSLSTYMMLVSALALPISAYGFSVYYTLRCGGKVMTTFILDSGFMWVVVLPICVILGYFTGMGIHLMFFICQMTEIIKCILGYFLLKRGTWVRRLV
jgi:putative MATE family efflux protein